MNRHFSTPCQFPDQFVRLLLICGLALACLSFPVTPAAHGDTEAPKREPTELERVEELLAAIPSPPEKIKDLSEKALKYLIAETRDPKVAERIAEAIRNRELDHGREYIRSMRREVCDAAFRSLLQSKDRRVIYLGLAYLKRVKDVDGLLGYLATVKNDLECPWESALEFLCELDLSEAQRDQLLSLAVEHKGDPFATKAAWRLRFFEDLDEEQKQALAASLRPGLSASEPWQVLRRASLLLEWDESEAMKHDVLQALRPHAAHFVARQETTYPGFLDTVKRCGAEEKWAPEFLKIACETAPDNLTLIAHLKGLCTPPVPLTRKEFLEAEVFGRMPGLLNGLLDVSRIYFESQDEVRSLYRADCTRLFWGEHHDFLMANREYAAEYALERLQLEGDPYAALMLAYLKDQRALPFLRFWYLHAVGHDYGWEGQPSLHFRDESFLWRYAYERCICHLTGKPLEEAIKLEPHERTWLLRRLRAWFSPMVPGPYSLEAYLLWRLDRELAREELCRRFREDRTGAYRALVANGILDDLIEKAKTKQDLLGLLGKPDSESVEKDCGDPGREYLAKVGQWTDRHVYLFPYSKESIQSEQAAICFFFRDDLLVGKCSVPSGQDPDEGDTITLIYVRPKCTPSENLIWKGLWSESETVADIALDLARDHPKGLEHFVEVIETPGTIDYRLRRTAK